MLAYYSGHRVGTFHLCDHKKLRYWRKIYRTEKQKCSYTVHGTAMVPLTPLFYLSDFQKSRYQRIIFWTEKWKCSHTIQGTGLVPFTCTSSSNWDIERKFLGPKNKNAQILFREPRWNHWHLPFTWATLKSGYQRKFFWNEKRKFVHTFYGVGLVPLTPPFHLYDLQKSRYRKLFLDRKTKTLT